MPGNSFGQLFKITTCGESHGGAIGVIIDGCPPNLPITEEEIQVELDRRKPGQSAITSPRHEKDKIHILSGVFEGVTTGTPILLTAYNEDMRPEDYDDLKHIYRPSHADYTYLMKYGRRDFRGSGRASARETLARVAAGAIAKKFLANFNIEIVSYVEQVGHLLAQVDQTQVKLSDVESNPVRCPDPIIAKQMEGLITEVRDAGDSIGGVIKCVIRHVMPGLGEPVFDKLPADLAKAMLSINAVKGFEIGSGFSGVSMRGSEHNDTLLLKGDKPAFATNYAGGTLGGISNGDDIYFRVAFKPVATISMQQQTLNIDNQNISLKAFGRHDPCVLPRAVPIVDAMAAIVVMDHYLRFKALCRN